MNENHMGHRKFPLQINIQWKSQITRCFNQNKYVEFKNTQQKSGDESAKEHVDSVDSVNSVDSVDISAVAGPRLGPGGGEAASD